MCGIAGYLYTNNKSIKNTAVIREMLSVQKHRGPDDSGIRAFSLANKNSKEFQVNSDQNIDGEFEGVLGFNRLSILDLSKNGHQPMCSPDEKIILTLNGEIYNAFDYKDELIASGFKFKSTSDTEVVLYLYMKYGFKAMLEKLNGMFAIVVVDLNLKKLFIARDRFGIKPMYFYKKNGLIVFSSELKSFFALKEFSHTLNHDLIDEYLIFRNNVNNTLIKDVSCLEPGTFITFSEEKGVETHRFFDMEDYQREAAFPNDFKKSIQGLKDSLRNSVQRQLMSDVKLGCQLSGGIDSSLVTHYAKDIKNDNLLESVSIIFDDANLSEEKYIDEVAKLTKIKSHKFELDASYYLKNFDKATWHFESPLNHPNTLGIYLLSQCAKNYVTVLLSGEGADEVLGGYSRFASIKTPYSFKTMASQMKKNSNGSVNFLTNYWNSDYRAIMHSSFMLPSIAKKLKPGFNFDNAINSRKNIYNSLSGSVFDKQVKYEMKTYLPDLLVKQDKMSMAHSIENRVPFLDNKLVEHSFKISEKYLLPDGATEQDTKYLLKKIAAELFGNAFVERKKQGFGIPLKKFFKDKEFNSFLNDEIVPGIISRKVMNGSLASKWASNVDSLGVRELDSLWILTSFEMWAKKYKL